MHSSIISLYNSLSHKIEPFNSINEKNVSMYCCGPTVYNFAHIGNMRSYIFEDILRRTLIVAGYHITHVMNITDVGHLSDDGDDGDDKMIKSARERGMNVWEIAEFFTDAFFKDSNALNILRPTIVCRATDHIQQMIEMILKIEKAGFSYLSGGNLYFNTAKDSKYGSLRGYRLHSNEHTRVEVDVYKKNPEDFVLWFTTSKYEHQAMMWESPWGKGYPGWHIECSAMSAKYLGEQFDIHCGGVDHLALHHTNELAQSRAAFGDQSANYWLHGEFLTIDRGKMSKSNTTFFTVSSLEEMGFAALDYRYFCLTAHYRKQLAFHVEALTAARNSRKKLMSKATELKKQMPLSVSFEVTKVLENFNQKLFNDLNAPEALADLWMMIKSHDLKQADKAWLLFQMDTILALGLFETEVTDNLPDTFNQMIIQRNIAKVEKNYQLADKIRHELLLEGIKIQDEADGRTTWCRVKKI